MSVKSEASKEQENKDITINMTHLNVKTEELKESFFKSFSNIRASRRVFKYFMLKKIRQKIESLSAKVLIDDKLEALKNYTKRMFDASKEMHNELFNKLNKLNIKLSDMKALMHQMLKKLNITKNSSDLQSNIISFSKTFPRDMKLQNQSSHRKFDKQISSENHYQFNINNSLIEDSLYHEH